jgi:hypothetical protein
VDYAEKFLNEYELDPLALQTILRVAQHFGEPTIILQALNTYGKLQELEQEVQTKLEAIKGYNQEIMIYRAQNESLESQKEDLYLMIGAIQEKHSQSRTLQNIANLLNDPSNAEISPDEFMLLSLHLLIGIRDFSFSNNAALPKWNTYVKDNIDTAVDRLNNIITGKL